MVDDKHAYLIIAHNQFNILQCLLSSVDDVRNDIYLHIDKKVKKVPALQVNYSNLYVIDDRIDVCWGDYSQIEAEMALFKSAYDTQRDKGIKYQYYHLLSGVDMPLKSQNYIHEFFKLNAGKEFLGFYQGNLSYELKRKVGVYHPFPRHFSKVREISIKSLIRAFLVRLQLVVGGVRNKDLELVRGTNWCSVTDDFVSFLLSQRGVIEKRFRYSFCADEVYKHTLCWNSSFKANIYDIADEAKGCVREINWVVTPDSSWLPSYVLSDYNRLAASPALFARKFDEDNIDIVYKILQDIKD